MTGTVPVGVVVPPQVASASGKPLSIAFEEVAAGKATYTRPDPEEIALAEAAALALLEGEGVAEVEVDGVEAVAVVVEEVEPVAAASDETVD